MELLLIFLLGCTLGSFLNVLVDRISNDESILGRSHCEFCKHILTWKDLIPLLSYIYLRGKCRYCHAKLSFQYPLLELVTGGLFVFTAGIMNYELRIMEMFSTNLIHDSFFIIQFMYLLFIVSIFIVVFFADLKYGIIPDKIIIAGVIITSLYLLYLGLSSTSVGSFSVVSFLNLKSLIINHLFSALGAFLFFLFLYLLTKGRGIGFGDVKLAFLMGLVLGFPSVFYAVYIAFLTGGFVGIILILWKKKKLKSSVPFGPFLILGSFISLFFSPLIGQIIEVFL